MRASYHYVSTAADFYKFNSPAGRLRIMATARKSCNFRSGDCVLQGRKTGTRLNIEGLKAVGIHGCPHQTALCGHMPCTRIAGTQDAGNLTDDCACIGAHVSNTCEIGEFRILSHDFNDGVWRVRWKVIEKSL